MTTIAIAALSQPGAGQTVEAFGTTTIRLTAAMTGGRFGLLDVVLPPGAGTPPHVHAREDEFFRVLSGRLGFWCGDEHVVLEEGGCIWLPRGVPHRFENVGHTDACAMVIVTPGGFEGFFLDVAARAPEGPHEIMAIGGAFGLTFPAPVEAAA
jgi:mannose-6-phosphate isomerase-like protein (cupin superfamily)